MIVRQLAKEVTRAKAQLCCTHQHILAGDRNQVADILSFEASACWFQIKQLPTAIESFAFSVMQIVSQSGRSPKERPA
jgi:hypothetical protein